MVSLVAAAAAVVPALVRVSPEPLIARQPALGVVPNELVGSGGPLPCLKPEQGNREEAHTYG
jgi:hypothetical protein